MKLVFQKKLGALYFSRSNLQTCIRYKFAGKTPFEQNKPTQSPFVTPRSGTSWNSSKIQKEVKPTIYPQP